MSDDHLTDLRRKQLMLERKLSDAMFRYPANNFIVIDLKRRFTDITNEIEQLLRDPNDQISQCDSLPAFYRFMM